MTQEFEQLSHEDLSDLDHDSDTQQITSRYVKPSYTSYEKELQKYLNKNNSQ